jgi:hypothetical protein
MFEGCYLLRRAEAQRLQRSHLNLVLADIIPPCLADLRGVRSAAHAVASLRV